MIYRTEQGFALEFYKGGVCAIHTPLGTWKLYAGIQAGRKAEEQLLKLLKESFGLVLLQDGIMYPSGYEGPYYKITKIDNEKLPDVTYAGRIYERNKLPPSSDLTSWGKTYSGLWPRERELLKNSQPEYHEAKAAWSEFKSNHPELRK